MSKTVLVTGSAGFVARFLVPRLIDAGYRVRGLDVRPASDLTGVDQWSGDIRDRRLVKRAAAGADCIVHLAAAHGDVGISENEYRSVNVEGTESVLAAARDARVLRFVFFSSIAVYGPRQDEATEGDEPRPKGPYGATKLAAEKAVERWVAESPSHGAVVLRPALVFGPTNRANMYRLIDAVARGRFLFVGDCLGVKSCAYVENVADATLFLMARQETGFRAFNYCDGPNLSVRELVERLSRLSDQRIPPFSLPLFPVRVAAAALTIAGWPFGLAAPAILLRAIKLNTASAVSGERLTSLGFRPRFSLEEGLRRTVSWYRQQGEQAKAA